MTYSGDNARYWNESHEQLVSSIEKNWNLSPWNVHTWRRNEVKDSTNHEYQENGQDTRDEETETV